MIRILTTIIIVILYLLFMNSTFAQSNLPIEVTRDIPYTTPLDSDDELRLLDVYAPVESGNWPAVVVLHGSNGSKNTIPYPEISEAIAESGAVVFNVNISREHGALLYREDENGAGIRRYLEEGICAIRFARAKVEEFGGRSDQLIVFGHSGGGYVGLWVSLVGNNFEDIWDSFATTRDGLSRQVGCVADDNIDVSVDALVGYSGAYIFFDQDEFVNDDPELQSVISTRSYIGENPDVLLRFVLGRNDLVMPDFAVDLTEQLYNDLADAGYNITWTVVEGGHSIPMSSPAEAPLMAVITEAIASINP